MVSVPISPCQVCTLCYFLERLSSEGAGRGEDREERGENRREVIRRHLAQWSQLRRLKSRMGIGRALVESDDTRGAFLLPANSKLVSMGTRPGKRNPGVRKNAPTTMPSRLGLATCLLCS